MFIVQVSVHVKENAIESFRIASLENARMSVQEPGIARFDVLQNREDPSRFLLIEVYRKESDAADHKQTEHYKKWRDTVESMMAEPRQSTKYSNSFPDDSGWG
ncbi:MAG TPA: antibiotic biosynthesis monooxygenase [Leptospiraceae bacterium]|nr:antibiotic biosynthesis monooxygenase [Leptospirales bacterium]HMU82277.1 antibiotic biosynthesis monooxygenase [Leptospiraceae bacterium]HMW61628.1 antibiotic biosynthesis monooxygenase [Leptospiraceae bacterium]HMX58217.1 antibiotic biosynthesis monooxygenase [Leptospiraceae bacterium]HMY47535.1 antibiotic biosynthesis monooxygenase [Leptospiraceae bacterium]